MKQFVFLLGALAAVTQTGWGGSLCTSGKLDAYIALGSGGCMIGGDTFSMFQDLPGTGGTELTPNSIAVSPSGTGSFPELTFTIVASSPANQIFESLFTYRISGAKLISSTITLSGASISGDGAVTDVQNLCENGTFGPDGVDGCTGNSDALINVAQVINQSYLSFAPAQILSVTDDFTIDGGTGGAASGGIFSDQFATPEPGTSGLLFLGFVSIGFLTRRFRRLS